jgi:integrase
VIGRRESPDGLPFRLYVRKGKFKVSYGYKLPNGKWAFRLTAPATDLEAIAEIRRQAIERAEVLNGNSIQDGTTADLIKRYFLWQESLPVDSEIRKAAITLKENKVEAVWLAKFFGAMPPEAIKPKHVYTFLLNRAVRGAPAKANKEIALLSAVLEYGRRLGELEVNPCRGIKYNKTRPRQKYVEARDLELALQVARERGGSYLVLALCLYTAYLTVSRPTEVRELARQNVKPDGIEIAVGKRKAGQAQRHKLIEWSPALRATIDEALRLQRTTSVYVFGNSDGQVYTRSGWNTIWSRLMGYCEKRAEEKGIEFTRFSLADMRPSAVTDRMEGGDARIIDATGHTDGRMVAKVYDRRKTKSAKATK